MATIGLMGVLAALTASCSSSKEHAAPASCDLSKATITTAVPSVGSAPGVIASVTRVGGMNESGAVTTVTVTADGQVDALADGPTRPHRRGTLDAAALDGLRRCIDESRFLDIDEGYQGARQGKSGDKFCTVTDAPEVTVVATGSSGETRTATGYALGVRGEGCDYGDPPALDEVHAALEQVRQVVSDTGSG